VAGALRAEALLADSEGAETLQAALDALDGCPSELERATTLLSLGAALRRDNRRLEARGPLHAALELAERIGAAAVADSARRELRAAGSRPRRTTRTGVDALSPQEHRIATLAADGHSNPSIAQTLFLSRKTVEMHLGHAYRKLGVSSRRDLPRALGGPD
jgi:DNA-binding CsgD family transcriptional regulator